MEKKGQVTIFIIVAIVLVVAGASFFIFKDSIRGDKSETPAEIVAIKNFVDDCIEKTFEETLIEVAKRGGYSGYNYLEEKNGEGLTYYFLDGENLFPSIEVVEGELSEYFERKIFLCLNGFSDFENYDLEEGFLESSVYLEEDFAKIRVNYPLKIRKGEDIFRLEDFDLKVQVRYGLIYELIGEYIFESRVSSGICLSCFNSFAEEGVFVQIGGSEKDIVFSIKDDFYELNGKPLEWVFVWEDE